jgi:hypothetical protein
MPMVSCNKQNELDSAATMICGWKGRNLAKENKFFIFSAK